MSKLMPVLFFSLIAAYISDKRSLVKVNRNGERIYIKKEKMLFILLTLVMAVFVGLRTSYNDTYTYRRMYESLSPGLYQILSLDFNLGSNPGFWVVNIVMRTIGLSTQNFLMVYSLITIGIYMWFIRKYSDDIWFSTFLFFTMGCYTFTMAAIKQCVAVAFCLIAVDRLIRRKKFSFIFWVLIASTFHPYSLMYLLAPFLFFEPWSGKTYLLLIIFGFIGFGLQSLLGTVVDITTMLGEEFDASSFVGEGINIFRLAVIWAPIILAFITSRYQRKQNSRTDNLILNLSMLNAEIMFIGLFGTANYFGRLANYFLMFQPLLLPHLLKAFERNSKTLMKIICVLCFCLYFYYANAINMPFNFNYRYISFYEYLKILVGDLL